MSAPRGVPGATKLRKKGPFAFSFVSDAFWSQLVLGLSFGGAVRVITASCGPIR
jgi:hypothetical protein